MERGVFVEGCALEVTVGDASRSLPELIFDCVRGALADAGRTMAEVDSIVISAEDLVDGRSLSSMITGPAAGAYLRDEIRVSDDGLVALSLGAARLESGEAERVVVASWGRASEGDPERSSARSFDPFVQQPLGLSNLAVSALRASSYLRRYGVQETTRREASIARQDRAERARGPDADSGPNAGPPFPLRREELRSEADVVVAVVLSPLPSGVRLAGIGHGTETFYLGERSLTNLVGARQAANTALAAAGLFVEDVDVIEVAGLTLWDEVLTFESIGAATPGQGLADYAAGLRLNPSGGGARGGCDPASGLAQFVELVDRMRRVEGACWGLAVAGSVVAAQTHTAVVVEAA